MKKLWAAFNLVKELMRSPWWLTSRMLINNMSRVEVFRHHTSLWFLLVAVALLKVAIKEIADLAILAQLKMQSCKVMKEIKIQE